ncbi:hypothetical protein SAMD00019534_087460 [Acytostelium subglobosum LB1]|uniref:hypothetical protein n=1 Tax=Acytostelium subglobosum LB1 TaxID=1410327 RepID=UPI00064511DC|nr:hypothetical protein SAMD00019534_087460 [Acytostelium subglobosum LB1]GAM25571.1 hypothetical protein SAMD00019534_087460 [Acytostelium subglobosum LB1]|eukprot:XP_012751557.1 hypothetical protein SAMD00019534_087460 [Acytostelium subglobosum LB1]
MAINTHRRAALLCMLVLITMLTVLPTSTIVMVVDAKKKGETAAAATHNTDDDTIVDDEDDYDTLSPVKKDVYKRNLVRENIRYKNVLSQCNKYQHDTTKRNMPSDLNTLVYVTPWNSKGYEMAELFNKKFTHVSPVWHQVKWTGKSIAIEGDHNVDQKWIARVRGGPYTSTPAAGATKIVPRYIMEGGWDVNSLNRVMTEGMLIGALKDHNNKHQYDGLVLEGVASHMKFHLELRNLFIERLHDVFHKENRELIVVIPPLQSTQITAEDVAQLAPYVDGFSLMTYDYEPRSGVLAPMQWIEENLRSIQTVAAPYMSKVMVGLPFYGYTGTYGGSHAAMVGHEYTKVLQTYRPKMQWVSAHQQHTFNYVDEQDHQRWVSYPTLLFIDKRLALAKHYGCSISIWEIGQGLPYFYDML